MESKESKILASALIATGLVLGGFFPGYYYYHAKMDANFVTVKGLAEKDVRADLAVWNLKYVVTGEKLQPAEAELQRQQKVIFDFFKKVGFSSDEIALGRLETNDLMANPYHNNNGSQTRYILTQNIQVRSTNVELIAKALNDSAELVAQGIIFDSQSYGSPVSYIFTKLNDIKPEMLEEATQNAEKAAAEFAKSSGTRVGRIRRANQGVFSILPREQTNNAQESAQIEKKVRVVSTVEYFLD